MTNITPLLKPATTFFINKTFKYQQVIDAEIEIDELLKYTGIEGQIKMLVGPSGTGKTNFIERLKKKYPPIKKDNFSFEIPQVIEISPIPGATSKMIYQEILEALSVRAVGNETRLKNQLKVVLRQSCVKLIVIDEIQHVLSHKSDSNKSQKVADTIKVISDLTKVAFLLVGLESSLKLIQNPNNCATSPLQQDKEQLFRRSRHFIQFTPIEYMDEYNMKKLLTGFIQIFEKLNENFAIKIINLYDTEVTRMLWAASQGYIGRLKPILRDAIELVEENGQIQIQHLANAYDKVNTWEKSRINPFKITSKALGKFIASLPEYEGYDAEEQI